MEAGQASLFEAYPAGYPGAFATSRAVVLNIFVPGQPVAKGRPRVRIMTPKGRKPIPQLYTPTKTKQWEEHVATTARTQMLAVEATGDRDFTLPLRNCRVMVNLRFNLEKPPSYPKSVVHATRKPDLDNFVKAVLDGLVNGGLIEDDDCITDLMTSKRYQHPLEHPTGVEIELTALLL